MTVIHRGSHSGNSPDVGAPRDAYWGDSAACREVGDPDLFFPRASATLQLQQAKTVCGPCPVRTECLQDALDQHVDYGVRGGLSEEERRAITGMPILAAPRAESPKRALAIAAAPEEYLRLVGDGLSRYQIGRALRTNMQTINEVARLLAERAQEQGAQALAEVGV
jgi:Transcription factor WhiB.